MAEPTNYWTDRTVALTKVAVDFGPTGTLRLVPEFTAEAIGEEANELASRYRPRDAAFARWRSLLDPTDRNAGPGLESMVSNDARTMFQLAVFLASSSDPQRTVMVGGQGADAEAKSGKVERALAAWWDAIDESRIGSGQDTFRHDLAHWMCLYGWYAVEFGTETGDGGEMVPVANVLDPAECYPLWSAGLERFVRRWETTVGECYRLAYQYGVTLPASMNLNQKVKLADWWYRGPTKEVYHAIVASGWPGRRGWSFVLEPTLAEGLTEIPVLVGRIASKPGTPTSTGSVLYENESVYTDFDKWLSFMLTLVKEKAQAPILAKGLTDVDETTLRPKNSRATGAIIPTDNPEAAMQRIEPVSGVQEVAQFLGLVESMLQRGGFPYIVYGGLGRELSGFAISQLLDAADRRVGPQVRRAAMLDGMISAAWLRHFRDGDWPDAVTAGYTESPKTAMVEEFKPSDVPKLYRVVTKIPIRVGNDMMAKMSIARQALGPTEQVLDHWTVLDEIIGVQDPNLVLDHIARDTADRMSLPVTVALNLKTKAEVLRASGQPGAEEAANMLDMMATQLLAQGQPAQGAPTKRRFAPGEAPPEAMGVSPDVIRAARAEGPPPNQGPEVA